MLKKIFLFIFCIFIFSGCSKQKSEEITFSSWGSITEVQILKKIITEFEKENPNIKVNFMHIPENYFQKLHLLFASNCEPDVVFINNLYLPIYESKLEDLSSIVKKEDFYKPAIDGLNYNNKQLAIPRDISNLIFYVNQDKFQNFNINIDLETLQKILLDNAHKNTYGISFEEDIYWMQPYLAYYGEIFNENFVPETSKGLQFYLNLRSKYKVAPTKSQIGSSTLAQMFLDEKIIFYLSGRWMYPKIKETAKFNWTIMKFPQGISAQSADTSGWAISKNSKHKASAKKFINYLANEKSSEYFTKTGLIVPARISTSNLLNNEKHNEYLFLDIIKYSTNTYVSKNYKKLRDNFNDKYFSTSD